MSDTESLTIEPEVIYLPEDAAKRLGVTKRWLQSDRSTRRTVPFIKIGHFCRYKGRDLLEFIERSRVGGVA